MRAVQRRSYWARVNDYTEKHIMCVTEAEEAPKESGDLETRKEPEGKQNQSTTECTTKPPAAVTELAATVGPADGDTMEIIETEGSQVESNKPLSLNSQDQNTRICQAVKRPLEGSADQQAPSGRLPSVKSHGQMSNRRRPPTSCPGSTSTTGNRVDPVASNGSRIRFH